MRRLLTFPCEGATLGATLDGGAGRAGVLFVTGGSQTRIGSHRLFERLAAELSGAGWPCLRFDRRGVGDSEGEDPGFRGNAADVAAAAAAFRRELPGLERIVGFGLCDGATSLALFGRQAGLEAAILVNPWFVEAQAGEPAAAAVKAHYRKRLLSLEFWQQLLSGRVSYRKALKGIVRVASPAPSDLAGEVGKALADSRLPVRLLLARGDATGIAALDVWNGASLRSVRERSPAPLFIESDSHTFARSGDAEALRGAAIAALGGF